VIGALALIPLSTVPVGRPGLSLSVARLLGPTGAEAVGRASAAFPEGFGRALTIGYLASAAAGIGWSLLGTWAMHRLVRSTSPASANARRLYETMPFEGKGRRPGLGVSGRVLRPVLVGGRRPMIVIPVDWDGDEHEPGAVDRLRLGMLHELAHAEQRDPAFHWAAGLAQAVWFAIPVAWWLRRQLRVDQEFLADNRAARRFGEASSSYATSLVDTAAGQTLVDRGAGIGGPRRIDPDGSALLKRVAMLVRCPFPVETSATVAWRVGIPVLAALLLVVASRVSLEFGPMVAAEGRSEGSPFPFGLIDLEIGPGMTDRPLRLPAQLPDRFELTMDLLVDPKILHEIAIAGVPLMQSGGGSTGRLPGPEAWHRIRLVVEDGEARVWIDDRPGGPIRRAAAPEQWLTISIQPGRSIRIRDLVLSTVAPPPSPASEATASRPPGRESA
jgi:hypothetical protein